MMDGWIVFGRFKYTVVVFLVHMYVYTSVLYLVPGMSLVRDDVSQMSKESIHFFIVHSHSNHIGGDLP